MADWIATSPLTWARTLGMVNVPLFGRSRRNLPRGIHSILLDGDKASIALSIGETGQLIADLEPLNWSWSSNVIHWVLVDGDRRQLSVRRWDHSDYRLDRPIPDEREAVDLIEELSAEPEPTAQTVVEKMLGVFRAVRAIIEARDGTETDLIRSFNALLVWADAVRRGLVDPNEAISRATGATLKDILPVLFRLGLIEFGPEALSVSARDFPASDLIEAILEREASTHVILDPDLFIRHASGVLYQEAHIELIRRPWTRIRQQTLFPVLSLEESSSRGEPQKDAHFTPPSLARALVQEAIRESLAFGSLPDRVHVLDPACGSGVFLIEALREITATTQSDVSLVGRDRSPVSCIITDFCLRRSASDDGERAPIYRVECADSLDMTSWGEPDLILMNPPFISWDDMHDNDRNSVKEILAGGRFARLPDASVAFVAKAVDSLKPGAVLATVVPVSFLNSSAAEKLRNAILADQSLSVRLIGRFRNLDYFRGATVEPSLLVIARLPKRVTVRTQTVRNILAEAGHEDHAVRGLRRSNLVGTNESYGWEIFDTDERELRASSWLPVSRRAATIFAKMRTSGVSIVSELFHVFLNVQTGLKSVFIIKLSDKEKFAQDPGFSQLFRPVADDVRNGVIRDENYVFYPYDRRGKVLVSSDEELEVSLPLFYRERLVPNRTTLAVRPAARGKRWWALNRPRAKWAVNNPKLVTPQFAKRGAFAFDETGRYVVLQGNAWFWKASELNADRLYWAYLSILNSSIFEAILSQLCPRVRGGQYNVNRKYINAVPIPDLSNKIMVSDEFLDELIAVGRLIAEGRMPISDTLDSMTARAYGFPLSHMRTALDPVASEQAESRFRQLAADWLSAIAPLSSIRRKLNHPLYGEIVAMGEPAIPFILGDIKRKPSHLVWALSDITGENPADKNFTKNILDVIDAWIAWGRDRGYEV